MDVDNGVIVFMENGKCYNENDEDSVSDWIFGDGKLILIIDGETMAYQVLKLTSKEMVLDIQVVEDDYEGYSKSTLKKL
jgi:hypothetical protein